MPEGRRPYRLIEEGTYRREAIVYAESEQDAERFFPHIEVEWKYTHTDHEVRTVESFDS